MLRGASQHGFPRTSNSCVMCRCPQYLCTLSFYDIFRFLVPVLTFSAEILFCDIAGFRSWLSVCPCVSSLCLCLHDPGLFLVFCFSLCVSCDFTPCLCLYLIPVCNAAQHSNHSDWAGLLWFLYMLLVNLNIIPSTHMWKPSRNLAMRRCFTNTRIWLTIHDWQLTSVPQPDTGKPHVLAHTALTTHTHLQKHSRLWWRWTRQKELEAKSALGAQYFTSKLP